jgi:hypothetical protein
MTVKKASKAVDNSSTPILPDLDNINLDDITPVNIDPMPDDPDGAGTDSPDAEGDQASPVSLETQIMADKMLIKTAVDSIGNVVYSITKIDAAKMDDISDQLADMWAGHIPELSPNTALLLATLFVVSPKVAAIVSGLKDKKTRADAGGADQIVPDPVAAADPAPTTPDKAAA